MPAEKLTTGLIFQKIPAIMNELEAIGKTKTNTAQGFKFRGVDDVYNALNPLLAKHKVFTVPKVLSERTEERQTKSGGTMLYRILWIRYRFYAEDGSFVDAVVQGEGADSGDKATNKAMAIAHKYALFQVFTIPTEEIARADPDNDSHELEAGPKPIVLYSATAPQKDVLTTLAAKHGVTANQNLRSISTKAMGAKMDALEDVVKAWVEESKKDD